MDTPPHIKNTAHWEKLCRRIRARALDLVEGRAGVCQTAREIGALAGVTGLSTDPDLSIFVAIDSASRFLPVGSERQFWDPQALAREDLKIRDIEQAYLEEALNAANRIVPKFAWALAARKKRRGSHVA